MNAPVGIGRRDADGGVFVKAWGPKDRITASVVLFMFSFLVLGLTGIYQKKRESMVDTRIEIVKAETTASIAVTEDEVWIVEETSSVTEQSRLTETEKADEEVSLENVRAEGKININTASQSELIELNGVGEVTAKAIIQYRENKKFESIEEIMEVKGIGEKKFEKIKDEICV